ncbi:hypothetical protein J421_4750 (plasmid) [Gemmatirosa kalamazoonensis]|uniref:SusD/RagB family nutrient-binding outer membrane lipoprotein n=1 Tax=Gemmatirosa kalamazoonensis TaxID=861299 RepID=W0RPM9_9BACT|nr:SusD/RagB family nutrient-binding outer membrane lipoprotein [Gemmatirosa kalamazoonensis]AHG92285.1 hypothetical protein J421_4750 [Gemmatirosa kalamazoonensis]
MRLTRISVAAAVVAAAITVGCSKDLTSLNVNPNQPTTAPASALFTNATVSTVQRFNGSFNTLSMTELFAQHIAQVQYIDEDRGHIRSTTIDALFTDAYRNELEDFQKIIDQGVAAKAAGISGPAQVMQSWVFQQLTDLWGDIPYSEALKGDIPGSSFTPKYDAQKDIYYGLLKTLTDASSALKSATDAGLGSADPIYKGNAAQWAKFANSMRARLAMRMSKADPTKADAELRAAIAAGLMTSNADNAQLNYPGDGVFDNPWSSNFAGRDDHRVSKTLLDTMNTLADPRVKIYAQPTKADPNVYAGLQNGLDNATASGALFNTTSRPGAIFYPGTTTYGTFGTSAGRKTPNYLQTYAEVQFILAEAAERGMAGLSAGAAKGYYDAGVRASITQWGGSNADADAYLARNGVAYRGGAQGLQQIGLQKWIAEFTQGLEAWSDWRRTGNPASIKPGPKQYPDVPGIPRRLIYPSNEQSVNLKSLTDAIARQGADSYLTHVWWDK